VDGESEESTEEENVTSEKTGKDRRVGTGVCFRLKPAFHGTDIDTDSPDTPTSLRPTHAVSSRVSSRVIARVGVVVGVVECGHCCTSRRRFAKSLNELPAVLILSGDRAEVDGAKQD